MSSVVPLGQGKQCKGFRVIFSGLSAKFRFAIGNLAAVASLSLAGPALANNSNADIGAPLRAAQDATRSVSGGQDEQFHKLFNAWQSIEDGKSPALAAVSDAQGQAGMGRMSLVPQPQVSIPSRVPLAEMVMTSSFGMRTNPVTGRYRPHDGVDLAAPIGSPVYATADGLVSRAAWTGGYGLFVSIEHGGGLETRYGHMSRLNVADGEHVHKGDIIGYVGSTGRSTGPHLHYEVRVQGKAVNPVPYLHLDQLTDASKDSHHG